MRFATGIAAFLLSAGTALGQDNRAADRAYIQKSESDWAETVATQNCPVVERILADDFVGVFVNGARYGKAGAVQARRNGHSKFAFNHLREVRVRFYGDTAIAQGSESWLMKKGKRGKFIWTDTWLKRNGNWQIVAAEDLMPVPGP
jgi:hypothetical protein